MERQFVSKEIVIELKNLGFNEPCFAHYRGNDIEMVASLGHEINTKTVIDDSSEDNYWIPVPLWQQVINWLREQHNLNIVINHEIYMKWWYDISQVAKSMDDYDDNFIHEYNEYYNSYEEALKDGILKSIEIIKEK